MGEPIDVNNMTDDGANHGIILVDFMSKENIIRKNAGLTVHFIPSQESMGDHFQVAPGEGQIHIYKEPCKPVDLFWGMGAEIVPGQWTANPEATWDSLISNSFQTHEEEELARALELSMQLQ